MNRDRAFALLLGTRVLSTLCTGLDLVVFGWLVIVVGGTPVALAAMAALNAAAGIPAAFFGGPLIDRYSRRAVTAVTEAARIPAVAVIPVLAASGQLQTWHLLVASAWVNGLYSLSSASYGALLPQLFDRAALLRANGLWQAASQVGVFIGAAVAGAAVSLLGEADPLLLGAGGRVLTTAGLLVVSLPAVAGVARRRTAGLLFRDMAEAWGVLRGRPALLWTTLFVAVPGSLISGINAVLPAFVKDDNHMDAAAYGLIEAAWGVGAFVVGLVLARMAPPREGTRLLAGSLAVTGATVALLAAARDLPWSMALAAVVGAAALGSLVLFRAHAQAEAPPEHTGRILAVSQLVLSAVLLVLALGLGALMAVVAVRVVIVVWGVAIAGCALLLRRLLRPAPGRDQVGQPGEKR
ncbi:MFS transporter [Actinokineospora auranticolor]|uniref:MFS transporter n=1 Tax=Actinokineospora auranticolor TaxID=155976 RepID=A0A2S6GPM4_9PSEU|nr:MFS transporter [Actinokineospora auranticolor]PPK67178.1 MFS transporter [Actinokineospora auranticolor]